MIVETVRPLEALHRAAERVGAVVCLTTTRDGRGPTGRRIVTNDQGAELSLLSVVRPFRNRDLGRWDRLNRGDVLCSQRVAGEPLDQVAAQLLAALGQRQAEAA